MNLSLAFPPRAPCVLGRGDGAGSRGSSVSGYGAPTDLPSMCQAQLTGLHVQGIPQPPWDVLRCNSVLLVSPDDEEEEEEDQEEEQPPGPRVYIGDVPSVTVIPKLVPQVLPEEQEGDEGMSDSDSEGPILYKDDEDEEEDESHNSKALTLQLSLVAPAELSPGCVEICIKGLVHAVLQSCWLLVSRCTTSSPLPFQSLQQPNLHVHLVRCSPSSCRWLMQ